MPITIGEASLCCGGVRGGAGGSEKNRVNVVESARPPREKWLPRDRRRIPPALVWLYCTTSLMSELNDLIYIYINIYCIYTNNIIRLDLK